MQRFRGGIVFLLTSAILAVAAASALAKPIGRCNAHRAHATKVTPQVIVYSKVAGSDDYGGTDIVYFACARPAGRSIEAGLSSYGDGEYPGNYSVLKLRVSGTYVAAVLGSGYADAAACAKYDGPNCQASIRYSVRAVNARARGWAEAPIYGASALAVSASGAVAWVQPTISPGVSQLRAILLRGGTGRLAVTQKLLDTGAIGSSLRFSGLTLSWTNSGQPKSQRLR